MSTTALLPTTAPTTAKVVPTTTKVVPTIPPTTTTTSKPAKVIVPEPEPVVPVPFFDDFTERNLGTTLSFLQLTPELRSFSSIPFSLRVNVPKSADGAVAIFQIFFLNHQKISSTFIKRADKPLSATLSPSFEWKQFDTTFTWGLSTTEKVSLAADVYEPFGFRGSSLELGIERKWDKVDRPYKIDSLVRYRNELIAAHASGHFESGFGCNEATFSVATRRGNWSAGVQPQFRLVTEEEDEADKKDEKVRPSPISVDYGVKYSQPDHSLNVGGSYDEDGHRLKFDWHHAPLDSTTDYAIHFDAAVAKEGVSDPVFSVSGEWTLNPETICQASCKVARSDLLVSFATTQTLSSYCTATFTAGLNPLKLASDNDKKGSPHTFGVQLTLSE